MTCKIFTFEQYSPEWWATRRGVPTASRFKSIITAKTCEPSGGADKYINELIADRFDPLYPRMDGPATQAMRDGVRLEPRSRKFYEMERGIDVCQVGFCLSEDGRFGCSPDALVGEPGRYEGILSLKNPQPHTHVAWLRKGKLPTEHRQQCHGELIVTGLPWLDFLSYGAPRPLLVRVEPDDYTDKLRAALEVFWEKYQSALAFIEGRDDTTEKFAESIRLLEAST